MPQTSQESIAISVVLITDDRARARLVRDQLSRVPFPPHAVIDVATVDEGLSALGGHESPIPIVLFNLPLPVTGPLIDIERLRAAAPAVPIVVLAAHDDEPMALRAVEAGAHDYVIEGVVTGGALMRSMRSASVRVRYDQSLQRERDAERTALLREQFIAILGHDLRNPLNTIVGSAAVLSRTVTDVQRGWLNRIASSADRMARMIDDVLDLTRGRLGGGLPTKMARVNFAALVRQAVADLRLAVPWTEVDLACPQNLWIECDADRMLQMLENLLSHANRHCAGGLIRVSAEEIEGVARLRVTHVGACLSADALAHLFDAFNRTENQAAAKTDDSLGLGLYIAEQIVSAHAGTIGATTTPQDGTTLTVRLPMPAGREAR
jgi:sigma-B regulation protein RsbU (phosphoserine phosphatase)